MHITLQPGGQNIRAAGFFVPPLSHRPWLPSIRPPSGPMHYATLKRLLQILAQKAQIIGAVNTVLNDHGVWIGENMDGKGFVRALQLAGTELAGKRITLLGAARAIAVECALAGAVHITIINRNRQRGEELAALIASATGASSLYLPWTPGVDIPADTDILIQATCVGLGANEQPDINYDTILPHLVASDVVFNPVMPAFLLQAKSRGAQVVTGIGILVQQGTKNFEL